MTIFPTCGIRAERLDFRGDRMSQETISKCLITLSNLKGRLDPGSRQAMSRKYTAVEEKGVKIGLSLISRAFVRERQGDVAAVTIVHVGQDEFRVIFGNNRRQGDKLLSSDAAFATRFLMKMMQWYSEQHPVLNDKAALAALREKQVDAILSHIAQTDSRKLVVRKMLALGRLGHWKSKGAEQELEREIVRESIHRGIRACQFPPPKPKDESEPKPKDSKPEFSDSEKKLWIFLKLMSPDVTTPKADSYTQKELLKDAIDFCIDINTRHTQLILNGRWHLFIEFCNILEEHLFVKKLVSDANAEWTASLQKLRRRLDRLVSYRRGAEGIVNGMFQYFRRSSSRSGTINLGLDFVAQSFPEHAYDPIRLDRQ
ncbi:hypothetical protein CPB85DRAFT_1429845 [Mucidula mucida]|nr:hypothetical protein CPB85DRAFT_1429845 [Mucidula mucida]